MKVLEREFSRKFEHVYEAALMTGKRFQFKDISEHPNPQFREFIIRSRGGLRETSESDPLLTIVYITPRKRDEDMEKVAVHELCHEILRAQGFDFKFRVNMDVLRKNLQRSYREKELEQEMRKAKEKLDPEFAYIYNSFTHVAINLCMKKHGYDLKKGKATYDKIRQRISEIEETDREQILLEAITYMEEIYKDQYSCSELKPSKLKNIYKKGNRHILEAATNLMRHIPQENLLDPKGCYKAIKALRDAFFIELGAPQQKSLFELRNPWTGISE